MTLIEQITTQALEERKARSPAGVLLTTLAAECDKIGKDAGGRAPTDEECVKVLQRFKAGAEQVLAAKLNRGTTADEIGLIEREIALYGAFLPEPLEGDALKTIVRDIAAEKGIVIEPRATGPLKLILAERYPGRVDGKALAGVIKDLASAS